MGYVENKIKRDWALMQFENGLGFGDGSDQMGLVTGRIRWVWVVGCYIRAVKSLFFHFLIPFLSLHFFGEQKLSSLSYPSLSSPVGDGAASGGPTVARRGGRPS